MDVDGVWRYNTDGAEVPQEPIEGTDTYIQILGFKKSNGNICVQAATSTPPRPPRACGGAPD